MRSLSPLILIALLSACKRDAISFDASEDADGDGFTVLADCNDANADVFPAAEETCNGVDDDCDGTVDGSNATDAVVYFVDLDGDGEPGTATPLAYCEAPANAFVGPTDCDDVDASVFPGADEVCNDRDDDCDGLVDTDDDSLVAGSARTFYEDADGDGYASSTSVSIESCSTPDGYALEVNDCDDSDASVFPGAAEVCNGADDNCNDVADDADPTLDLTSTSVFYIDRDADGYGGAFFPVRACEQPEGTTVDATDCDDVDARIYPGATEICDGRDNDCNGDLDDADAGLDTTSASLWFADSDADGFGDSADPGTLACAAPTGTVANASDCVDSDPAIAPNAPEVCNDIDDDCDSRIDDVDPSLDAASATRWWADRDNDGVGGTFFSIVSCEQPDGMVEASGDCEDDNNAVSPNVAEVCNGIDDNCNDLVDDNDGELDLSTAGTWYADADDDGWGSGTDSIQACIAPIGFGTDQSDCDDQDPNVSPDAQEVCNGIDDNCNGSADDQDQTLTADGASYFRDNDNDGFGTANQWACMDFGFGWSDTVGDCDDFDSSTYPSAPELCDFRDNDCDDQTDEDPIDGQPFWSDSDFDGYGTGEPILACGQGSGVASQDGDCNDEASDINPNQTEICDGRDNNCDGNIDTDTPNLPNWYIDADADGYGLDGSGVAACSAFDGRVDVDGDCDDSTGDVGPDALEIDDDGVDNDCDGNVDIPDPLTGGLITEDITWGDGSEGSFELDFNALVDSGVTLTIEPCTRILMAPDATLQVEGTLIAQGREDCPIVFTSSEPEPAPGDWARLFFTAAHVPAVFDDTTGEYLSGSILEHVVVEYAGGVEAGIVVEGTSGPLVSHTTVRHNAGAGLLTRAQNGTVLDSAFVDNDGTGFSASVSNKSYVIERSEFSRNLTGLRITGQQGAPSIVRDNLIADNQSDGLLMYADPGQPWDVSGNRFIRNGAHGIRGEITAGGFERNLFIGNRDGFLGGSTSNIALSQNVFADSTDSGVVIGSYWNNTFDIQGNQFWRNGRHIEWSFREENIALRVEENTFGVGGADQPWVTLSDRQSTSLQTFLLNNNFIGGVGQTWVNVGYLAGSSRVPMTSNYWAGVNPNVEGDAIIDFIDDSSLAVADASDPLDTPNVNAPISVPTGVMAESDGSVVTLFWDAVPNADVAGYRVHYGLQTDAWLLDGTDAIEGMTGFNVSGTTATVSGLDLSQPWRFAITAVDADAAGTPDDLFDGHESWFSVIVQP